MGLGPYPDVSIADARVKADRARQHRDDGYDPIQVRDKNTYRSDNVFREWSVLYIATNADQKNWTPGRKQQQERWLAKYVYPSIGKLPIAKIETWAVYNIVSPLWKINPTVAADMRGLIERIWDFAAVLTEWEGANPARWRGRLDKLLISPTKVRPVRNHPSVAYSAIALFYAQVCQRTSVSRVAIAVIILTGTRTNMATGARREEFDLENKIWTIPGNRVKGIRNDFRVPLSDAVIVLLDLLNIRDLGPTQFVFPGRKSGRPLSRGSLLSTLKTIDSRYTVHGFRSTLRTWGFEYKEKDFRQDIVEMALAHLTKVAKASGVSSVEVWRAYQRGDALEKRRKLMDAWAVFVTGAPDTGSAITTAEAMLAPQTLGSGQFPAILESLRLPVLRIEVHKTQSGREHGALPGPMGHTDLTDAEWAMVEPLLRSGRVRDARRIVNGILWMQRTERGFGDIPKVYGKRWATYYNQFMKWRSSGVWKRIIEALDHSSAKSEVVDPDELDYLQRDAKYQEENSALR
jgi:integrase